MEINHLSLNLSMSEMTTPKKNVLKFAFEHIFKMSKWNITISGRDYKWLRF